MPGKKEDAKKMEKAAETSKEDTLGAEPEKAKVKAAAAEVEAAEEKPKKTKAKKASKKSAGASNVEKIVEVVESMTVLELADLVKVLEERFDVTAAAPMAMMPGVMPGAAAEEAEEKTEFDVILKDVGSQKIQVIKVVRAITSLGLIEAKKLVEDAPKPIKEAVSKEEAEEIKKKVEEVGATIEIK